MPAVRAPYDVAVDGLGNVYLADLGNVRVRKVTVATGVIQTVAGGGNLGLCNGAAWPPRQALPILPVSPSLRSSRARLPASSTSLILRNSAFAALPSDPPQPRPGVAGNHPAISFRVPFSP